MPSFFQQAYPMPVRRAAGPARWFKPKPDPVEPEFLGTGRPGRRKRSSRPAPRARCKSSFKLAAGPYRAVLETKDRFGKPVTALLPIQVLQPQAKTLAIRVAEIVAAPKWTLEPGEEFQALWGTGYDRAGPSSRSSIAARSSRPSGRRPT